MSDKKQPAQPSKPNDTGASHPSTDRLIKENYNNPRDSAPDDNPPRKKS